MNATMEIVRMGMDVLLNAKSKKVTHVLHMKIRLTFASI